MAVEQAAGASEMMKELISYIAEKVINGKSESTRTAARFFRPGRFFRDDREFLELQRIAGRKVPASKVQAKDMDTVRLMFATAERFGKPVKA